MRVSKLNEDRLQEIRRKRYLNELVDLCLYGECLEENIAEEYFNYLYETLCKVDNHFHLLQEAFVNDDFVQVIDVALNNSKMANNGKINSDDVFEAIKNATNKFTSGEKTKNGTMKRWLDFDNNDEPFYVNDIDASKSEESIKNIKEKNKKKFMDWFSQTSAKAGYQQLISKYEKDTMFTGNNHYTMQTQINEKFISDCIAYYLECLKNNSIDRYKLALD